MATSGLPKASSREYPVISAVLSFHSLILPSASTPKIGALALFTSCRSSLAAAATALSCLVVTVTSWATPTTVHEKGELG